MPASIVESTSPGLLALIYDGDRAPSGILDARVPPGIIAVVLAVEPLVRDSLDSIQRRMDCLYATPAWQRALEERGIEAQLVGGVGVDDDQFTSDYRIVPLESRSGYREGDGRIHRHFWLLIGADHLLFDPTAHQFDAKGGVSRDRYVIDGRPLAEQPSSWPTMEQATGFVAGMRRQFDVLRQMRARLGDAYQLARQRGRVMSAAYRDAGAPRRVTRVRTRDGWAFERHVRLGPRTMADRARH